MESDTNLRSNICFDCQRATGGCSWSEIDPNTGKPRFVPVPGWEAELVVRKSGKKTDVTWQITGCPLFIRDVPRNKGKKEKTMANRKPAWDAERARRLLQEGYSDLQVAEMVGASASAIKSWKYRNSQAERERESSAPARSCALRRPWRTAA